MVTMEDRRVKAITEKVRDAVRRAEEAGAKGDMENYNYWKGVAHGLNRGWDIHTGCCL